MLLPPAEACWTEVLVERDLRVAGDVFPRNGQRDRDWRNRVSMLDGTVGLSRVVAIGIMCRV